MLFFARFMISGAKSNGQQSKEIISIRTGWVEENYGLCSYFEICNSIERSLLSMNLALDPRPNAAFGGLFSTTTSNCAFSSNLFHVYLAQIYIDQLIDPENKTCSP